MKNVGGEEINFFNKFFVVTHIILTCRKPQGFNLQPLDTFHTHAHEVHSDLHVLEELEVKQDEEQAIAWFLRDYELPLGKCCTVFEEEHDHTVTEPTNGGIFVGMKIR